MVKETKAGICQSFLWLLLPCRHHISILTNKRNKMELLETKKKPKKPLETRYICSSVNYRYLRTNSFALENTGYKRFETSRFPSFHPPIFTLEVTTQITPSHHHDCKHVDISQLNHLILVVCPIPQISQFTPLPHWQTVDGVA